MGRLRGPLLFLSTKIFPIDFIGSVTQCLDSQDLPQRDTNGVLNTTVIVHQR